MNGYVEFAQRVQAGGGPERVVLVNDGSGSMFDDDWEPTRIAGVIEAGSALIRAKAEQYEHDEIGIVLFGTRAHLLHKAVAAGPNSETLLEAMAAAEEKAREAEGCTNMTAGLEMAGSILEGRRVTTGLTERLARLVFGDNGAAPNPNARRRVILLTDGCHNHGPGPRKIATQLKGAGTVIDCIGIGGSPKEVDEKLLKALASPDAEDRPRYRFIGDKQGLIRTYKKLAGRLRA